MANAWDGPSGLNPNDEEDTLAKRLAKAPPVAPPGPIAPVVQKQDASTGGEAPLPQYTNPFSQPSDSAFRKALKGYDDQAQKLADTGVDTSDIKQNIEDAKQAYKDKSDRNDWGEVAQMIATSLAKAGGALAGQRGHFQGVPTAVPEVDYNKRREQAGRDYGRDLDQFDKEASERRLAANEQRQSLKDALAGPKEAVDFESKKYGGEATDYRQGALGAMRANTEAARTDALAERNEGRQAAAEKARVQRESLKELRDEETHLLKQDKTLNEGLGLLASPNPKDQDKATAKLTEAGVPSDEIDAAKEAAKGENTWYQFGADPKKTAAALQKSAPSILAMKQRLDELKQSKAKLIGRGEGAAPELAAPPVASSSPAAGRDAKIVDYAKQNGLQYDAAKKVLVNRGYTPAE